MHPHPLWVCRHGETVWNREGRWQGSLDSPLTARGEGQARAVGDLLARLDIRPDRHRVLTSPQGRARRTAELALSRTAVPASVEAEPRLREIGVGLWTGLHRDAICAKIGPMAAEGLLAAYAMAPEGEPLPDLMVRVRDLLADLDGPAILFTHGITSRFLRAAALGLDLSAAEDLPGGQGVVHHLQNGHHRTLDATTGAVHDWTS